MFSAILFIILVGLSYVCGSFCSAVIVCNFCKLPDPRSEGSKNPGATNVLRISGKKYAAIVLLADILKGFIPVFIGKLFGFEQMGLGIIGLAAVMGHIYPYFFDFKGGKGVATALGVLFGAHFMLGVLSLIIWIMVAFISRYSSLASIVTLLLAPLLSLFYTPDFFAFIPLLVMCYFIVYNHKENFERLQKGSESKINL
ncbi:MAG: glycerol-3-phosphate 1-O-acyltransferase PlsY [Legionellaceae bacterium]|nr:glycerol-3-phosphate 1-O-acyltransferase PlsY [Legionellaceae bacterium]